LHQYTKSCKHTSAQLQDPVANLAQGTSLFRLRGLIMQSLMSRKAVRSVSPILDPVFDNQEISMNEIIQRLIERTGLPEAQAAQAAEVVIGYLKEKLPPSVASQIDGLAGGESGATGMLGGIGARLGDMFGRKE
jgi:hypothetical protein